MRRLTSRGAEIGKRTRYALPTFIVIGAQKAGTTSLYEYLRTHPNIGMAQPKELDFFSFEGKWRRGLDWYRTFFPRGRDRHSYGEISPSYAMSDLYPAAPARLARSLPNVKILYMVRHPVDRIASSYIHHVFTGEERRDPVSAVTKDSRYLTASCYGLHLNEYLGLLPPEQVMLCSAEQLRSHREQTMRSILRFIGVETKIDPAQLAESHHPSGPKRTPWRGVRSARDPGFVKRRMWAPDRRPWPLQALTTKPFPPMDEMFPPSLCEDLWSRMVDDMAVVRRFVGGDEFDKWNWQPRA